MNYTVSGVVPRGRKGPQHTCVHASLARGATERKHKRSATSYFAEDRKYIVVPARAHRQRVARWSMTPAHLQT